MLVIPHFTIKIMGKYRLTLAISVFFYIFEKQNGKSLMIILFLIKIITQLMINIPQICIT